MYLYVFILYPPLYYYVYVCAMCIIKMPYFYYNYCIIIIM